MKIKFFFLAALLCGVANQVSAQAPATAPAATPAGATTVTVTVEGKTQSATILPGASATVELRYRGKGKAAGVVPLKVHRTKTRRRADGRDWQEETSNARTCVKREGADDRCVEWNDDHYSPREEIEAAEARAKAHTDQAVAGVRLPMVTQMEGNKLVTRAVLPGSSCPVDQLESTGSGNFRCKVAMSSETFDPVQATRAQVDRVRILESRSAQAMRKPDDATQRTELMMGGGALGIMNVGGGPVAVADLFVDTKRVITNVVLHGAVGELSDGQGTTGCVAVGGAKPFEAGGATTVGVLGGYCFTTNADLAHSNFWHADLQFRHRMTRWLVLGFDVLGGALWSERVVNQTVREVRDPAFGALGSIAVNFSL